MSERGAIAYLLVKTLGEFLALPFHLLWFGLRRRAIRAEIREILTSTRRPRAGGEAR